jgi:hypothetical protein
MKNIIRRILAWFSPVGTGDATAEMLAGSLAKGTMR